MILSLFLNLLQILSSLLTLLAIFAGDWIDFILLVIWGARK